MFQLIFALSLLLGASAEAAPITAFQCAAVSNGFQLSLSGRVAGTQAVGNSELIVRAGGIVVKRISFAPRASRFLKNDRLHFSGSSAEGSGTIRAAYVNGTSYAGSVQAVIDGTAVNASVQCKF
ncbi:MAG: hypothetical protein EOP11_09470 [Proteobacteria bacterium]|nr:MAG: hypothetical protein EOP11_09470 [Pseudomonadota bacterium]